MYEETFPKLIFRYEGEFDFQGLYERIADFFRRREYDFWETGWKEKDGTPQGREITMKFKPDLKVNEYIRYRYEIQFKAVDAHWVNKNTMHARFHIHVQPKIQFDWQSIGVRKGKKKHFLVRFYENYLFNKEAEHYHVDAVEQEVQKFLDEVKEFLGVEL
ncbi:MAG: hypothetical protein ACMXYD_02760 [Candidatus Woesearchaeota archaeon]